MAEIKVIDVSAWNGNVDFSALVSHGVKAGIIRITERYDKTDSYFERNYTGFKSVGIKTGVYKFSYALSVSEIQKEARTVISVLNGRKLDYPVFLDLEWSTQRALGKSAITKMVKAFRKIIVDAGYQFAIYCNVDWYNNALDTASLPYDYWLAAYPANDTGAIVERIRPNKGIAWQYTSKYKINGKNFDMSVFYKDHSSTSSGGDQVSITKEQAIARMIEIATAEIGYLEKASNSQLDSKTANAGSNNYTKYWRDTASQYQGQAWCAIFVSWVLMKAFGIETAKKLLKHWPYIYCPTLGNLFTRYANPEVGDIVIFWRSGTFAHTGIVIRVEGDRFWTIEGNTSGGSTIVANGGGVCQKSYYNSQLPGTKFCRLDWSLVTSINDSNSVPNLPTTAYNTPWVGKCTADDVNVRTGAGTTYPNASYPKLNKDNRMDVLGETGEWYYVNIQGNKGYISKKYVEKVKSSSSGNTPSPTKTNKVIKNGQVHANNFAATGIATDGIRGAATIKAAKKVLQQGLNLDYRAGLEIDGEIGILTHRALGNHYVEYGEKQYMVTVLEILLMLKGYETSGVESPGTYGSGLKSAVKKWAADNGISVNSNGRVTASMFLKLVQ